MLGFHDILVSIKCINNTSRRSYSSESLGRDRLKIE